MYKKWSYIFGFLLLPVFAVAQKGSISGTISDSSLQTRTTHASVVILQQSDSVLVQFTRSDKEGKFKFQGLSDGNYILLITYPEYGDYVDRLTVSEGSMTDLKNIYITPRSKLLDEIVIRQAAIRIKGDTTEYLADSFAVKENASVEDLLNVLPGISVDRNGKIIAQGKQIQKVLVDGDEFFSDDPTIATRNLRADAIDKVQVFEKKSDQAAFTGIDDGETTKTLNLKLKENAKKGYFGKISAGGLDKYYNASAMINAFKAKRKFSAFGVASSTDQTGLNFGDSRNLGFSSSEIFSMDGGGIAIIGSSANEMGEGNFMGQGLPESMKAGVHFSDKWKENKYSTGGNYIFNKLSQRGADNSFSKNILLDSVYYSKNESSSYSDRMQHSLDGQMEINLDSSSSLKITAAGNTGTNKNRSTYHSQALSKNSHPVNSSIRNTSSAGDNHSFNTSAIWRKKFKKQGRSISLSFNQRFNESKSDGYLLNESLFYDTEGNIISQQNTDQFKINNNLSNTIRTRLAYTEPLSSKSFLEVNYSFDNNSSTKKILSYNKDAGDKYTQLADSLSNHFKYVYNTNTGGLNYRLNEKKYSLSFGANVSNTGFEQTDYFKDTSRSRSYYNLFPRGSFSYKFSAFSNLRLSYQGSTSQPTIDQLQPLQNNDDPLNVLIGNPSLKQQFSNNLSLNYHSFKMISEQVIFAGINYSSVKDQISNSYIIDSLGRRVTQFINVDGNYHLLFFGNLSTKIGKTGLKFELNPNFNFSESTNFINGVENISKSWHIAPRIGFFGQKNNVYSARISATPSYNNTTSSISKGAGTRFWIFNYTVAGDYQLPGKFEIGTDIDFQFRQKLSDADNNNDVIYWNTFIEKKFLKNDQLTLRASVNDILNQNKGYSRTVQPNAVVERNYLTFQRYGLLTLTYNFNTTGTKASSSKGGGIIKIH